MEQPKVTDKFIRNIVERLAARSVHPSAIGDGALAGQVLTLGADLIAEWVSPVSGVTDHGLLTGLSDDDHPQYHNNARGDARYWPLTTDLATQVELDAHISDATAAHDASAISIVDAGGHYTSTNVEGALQEAATAGGGASDLDDLSDVTIGTPATGEVLRFNGSQWVDATLAATDVSGFDTKVRTSRLNQMTVPNAAVPMGSNKLTGLAAGTANGNSLRYEQLYKSGALVLLGGVMMPLGESLSVGATAGQPTSVFSADGMKALLDFSDSQPAASVTAGGFYLGAGGISAQDWRLSRTAANEATIAAGDVLKLDTRPEGTSDTTAATTEFVGRATGNASTARPYAKFRRSAVQAITPTNTPQAISWDTVDSDNASWRVGATPTRFVATSTGVFNVTASCAWSAAGTNQNITIYKNGATTGFSSGVVGDTRSQNVSGDIDLIAGDYIEIFVSTGVLMNVTSAVASITFTGGTGAAWGNAGGTAKKTATQSAATGTWTAVTFDAEEFDIDGVHSTSSNTDRLTCVTPGTFMAAANFAWDGFSGGVRQARIRLFNSAGTQLNDRLAWSSKTGDLTTGDGISLATIPFQMSVGDYIILEIWQNVTASLGTASYPPKMGMVRVGYQTNPNKDGQRVTNGRVVHTSVYTSASLAAWADSGALCTGLTLTGDGVNAMILELTMYGPYLSAGTAGHFDVFIWDGTIGSGTRIGGSQQFVTATGISAGGRVVRAYVAPFTGSKTFTPAFRSGATSQTLVNQASAVIPTIFTATWAVA